jgi:hypothetical protein
MKRLADIGINIALLAMILLIAAAAVAPHSQGADVPNYPAREYCLSTVGQSYVLVESCLEMEAEARRELEAMPPTPGEIKSHCQGIADSARLYLTCVRMELKAMGRLQQ